MIPIVTVLDPLSPSRLTHCDKGRLVGGMRYCAIEERVWLRETRSKGEGPAGWTHRTRDPISFRLNLVQLGVVRPVVLARRSSLA